MARARSRDFLHKIFNMSKVSWGDIEKFQDEPTIEKFKKKPSGSKDNKKVRRDKHRKKKEDYNDMIKEDLK